mgnify:CR=1 FL=1
MSTFPAPEDGLVLPLKRGDDCEFTFTLTKDGSAWNLTGATKLWLTLKQSLDQDDDDFVLQLTLGSGLSFISESGGTVLVSFTAAQLADLDPNATYYWDFQVKESTGKIRTPDNVPGLVEFVADTTRAIT